ncbi:hypothetical protein NJO91_30010 [Streptomyces microflavus]|uniref:hypothetical protein n=1 Tax=Streptomyces microflavus TaxID=1919 RepID=UPI0029BB4D0A|nr:hypothetical protein [Streptomyces microflavus]MDX2407348.1 hypothetical protein [Streptomyces microflavus]
MNWLHAAYWGAFGGFAMEALDYCRAIKWHRQQPWRVASASIGAGPTAPRVDIRPGEENLPAPGFWPYLLGAVFRIVVGGGVAGAVSASTPGISPWVALITGAGALPVLERVTSFIPLLVRLGKDAVVGAVEQQQAQQQASLPPPTGQVNGVPAQQDPGTIMEGGPVAEPMPADPRPGSGV